MSNDSEIDYSREDYEALTRRAISQPLVTNIYTADPSAHVFEGKLFLYPSHDRDSGIADNDLGDQYDMADYHVFSLEEIGGPVTDHGVVLTLGDVPWAAKQLWAPDAAFKDGRYYLYFPARDKQGIFRIGVAIADKPQGPFKAEPEPIKGSYSIDPCSFVDDDGRAYLYFGGIWGGQLQGWEGEKFDARGREPVGDAPAIYPRVAELNADMKSFKGPVQRARILDENGAERLLGQGDMLYLPPSASRLIRAQGVLVTDNEIHGVVEFVSNQSPPAFDTAMHEKLQSTSAPEEEVTAEDEELVEKCIEIIRQEKRASTSLLQRRLRLGYTRAARIVDILEQRGILGPGEGAKPREILVDLDAAV